MQEVNKFYRLWFKNALPGNNYITYYLQKIKLKDDIWNIDENNFIDRCVINYANLRKTAMNQKMMWNISNTATYQRDDSTKGS